MYTLAETYVVFDVTTASLFLSCQVYIPSIKHSSKKDLISVLFVYMHFWRPRYIINVAQKTATHGSVIFPATVFSK